MSLPKNDGLPPDPALTTLSKRPRLEEHSQAAAHSGFESLAPAAAASSSSAAAASSSGQKSAQNLAVESTPKRKLPESDSALSVGSAAVVSGCVYQARLITISLTAVSVVAHLMLKGQPPDRADLKIQVKMALRRRGVKRWPDIPSSVKLDLPELDTEAPCGSRQIFDVQMRKRRRDWIFRDERPFWNSFGYLVALAADSADSARSESSESSDDDWQNEDSAVSGGAAAVPRRKLKGDAKHVLRMYRDVGHLPEKAAYEKARINQSLFRSQIETRDGGCILTGIRQPSVVLEAAHLVAVADASRFVHPQHELQLHGQPVTLDHIMSPDNGILLKVDFHRLFDSKEPRLMWFSVTDDDDEAPVVRLHIHKSVTFIKEHYPTLVEAMKRKGMKLTDRGKVDKNGNDQLLPSFPNACIPFLRHKLKLEEITAASADAFSSSSSEAK